MTRDDWDEFPPPVPSRLTVTVLIGAVATGAAAGGATAWIAATAVFALGGTP